MLEEGIELQFTDSGHILGAAAVHLTITENGVKKTFVLHRRYRTCFG